MKLLTQPSVQAISFRSQSVAGYEPLDYCTYSDAPDADERYKNFYRHGLRVVQSLAAYARSLGRTDESIATPFSVNTYGE